MSRASSWFLLGAVSLAFAACDPVSVGGSDASGIDASTIDGYVEPPPEDCDGDNDDFYHPHPACDEERGDAPPDCDDERSDVHPGAPVVCGDDAVNNCADLPDEVKAAFGVEEIGFISADAVFLGEVGGFHNNVSIAAVAGSSPVAIVTAMESAMEARVVRFDYDNPATAVPLTTGFQTDVRPANHDVEVVRMGNAAFRIGTLGLINIAYDHQYRPLFADFSATDSRVDFVAIDPGTSCPLRGEPEERTPSTYKALSSLGDLFFEVASTDSLQLRAFHATPDGVVCRNLVEEGITYSEFGTQVTASGGLGTGIAGNARIWTWDSPANYQDFHFYETSEPINGQGALLARDIMSSEPVIYVYPTGSSQITVEAMDCAGLDSCTRTRAANKTVGAPLRSLGIAPLGTGAVVVAALQPEGFGGPTDLELHFVNAGGSPIGGGFTVHAGSVGRDTATDNFRWLHMTAVSPTAAREWHDILVAMAVERTASDQPELRVARARACNAM